MPRKLFIIGSGFTYAAFHNTTERPPLNADLMTRMQSRMSPVWATLSARYGCNDVEVALTRLDLELNSASGQNQHLLDMRRQVEADLSEYFTRFRFREDVLASAPWLGRFVQGCVAPGDVFVSLNYDCFLEGLLDRFGLWTPNGGYGATLPAHPVFGQWAPSPVSVLKVHGSESFHREHVYGGPAYFKSIQFEIDGTLFPVSGANKHFSLRDKNSMDAVIAPSFVKSPPHELVSLSLEALDAAQQCDVLVVIGCGFRREDALLWLLLWRSLKPPKPGVPQIVILDPSADAIALRIDNTTEYTFKDAIYRIPEPLDRGYARLAAVLQRV